MAELESSLDQTSLGTITLLESRLLRLENVLFGQGPQRPRTEPEEISAVAKIAELERRLGILLARRRVYTDLIKIYNADPSLFHQAPLHEPPTHLSSNAVRATVLASAASYPAAASALAAVRDIPVPDSALSASLAALVPRMQGIEAVQMAQRAEVAELRARSEAAVRRWYEGRMVPYSQFVAAVEARVERADVAVRRAVRLGSERAGDEDDDDDDDDDDEDEDEDEEESEEQEATEDDEATEEEEDEDEDSDDA